MASDETIKEALSYNGVRFDGEKWVQSYPSGDRAYSSLADLAVKEFLLIFMVRWFITYEDLVRYEKSITKSESKHNRQD